MPCAGIDCKPSLESRVATLFLKDPEVKFVMRITTACWLAAASLVIAGCGGGGGTTCTSNCVTSVLSVAAVTPANGATGVAINSAVVATFNMPVNIPTLTASTFTLTPQGGAAVAATVTAVGTTAQLSPNAPLAYNTTYTATLTTGVQSSAGTALAANYTWSFATAPIPVPVVSTTVPANGATGVDAGNPVTATFNEAMNASTITTTTFTLSVTGGASVTGAVSYTAGTETATFTPSATLAYNTSYTATITTGATSSGGVALAGNSIWTFTTSANPSVVAVDFGTTYQTIRGFGGSTAWLGQLTTQQANALFSPTTGLGLSILRVRIDPEGTSTTTPPYYTGEWAQELANAQEAQSANSNAIVFASPWTPPTAMKTSSTSQPYYSGAGACSPGPDYCGGYLNPASYAAYASYLEDFVTYFSNNGVNLYAISMQNEPDWSAQSTENYESCSWTAQQMDTWVASLTANNATNPITTKLIMPESLDFNTAQSNPTLADPNAVGNVAIIGGHLYGTSPAYYGTAINDGKDVWMTEHYLSPSGAQPTIADALALAEEIHNSMTVGNYNAYVYWWIWNDPNDSINYGLINSSTTSPSPTYYGDAIGQFSQFIQPGYVRVSATASPLPGVFVSAYSNNSPAHYVIVAINSNSSPDNLTFTLANGTVTSVTPYETTSTETLSAQPAVTVSGGQFNYTLPAQSIVTFVQ